MSRAVAVYAGVLERAGMATTMNIPASTRARLASRWQRRAQARAKEFERGWRRTGVWIWGGEGGPHAAHQRLSEALEEYAAQRYQRDMEGWRRTLFLEGLADNAVTVDAREGARAVRAAWEEALGGEDVVRRTLARYATHKGKAPGVPSAGRIETLATMDETVWRTLEQGAEWARRGALARLTPETIARGPLAWAGALARNALAELLGKQTQEGEIEEAALKKALEGWRWAQTTPPLGVAALLSGEPALRSQSAWAGAVRLEANPKEVRTQIGRLGRAKAAQALRRKVEREAVAVREEVAGLARQWRCRGGARDDANTHAGEADPLDMALVEEHGWDEMAWEIGLAHPLARDAASEVAAAWGMRRTEEEDYVLQIRADRNTRIDVVKRRR